MYLEHNEGLLSSHAQKFAEAQFGELEEHPCSATESATLTALTALLALSPFIVIFAFVVA
jgi:hypothetical protein